MREVTREMTCHTKLIRIKMRDFIYGEYDTQLHEDDLPLDQSTAWRIEEA